MGAGQHREGTEPKKEEVLPRNGGRGMLAQDFGGRLMGEGR